MAPDARRPARPRQTAGRRVRAAVQSGAAARNVFTRRVLAAVRRIPAGRVATYGDIAALAGAPRASRAVGNIMRGCSTPGVPCHRVVAAGGRVGGYGGNEALKRSLLRAEGLFVSGARIKDFSERRWP